MFPAHMYRRRFFKNVQITHLAWPHNFMGFIMFKHHKFCILASLVTLHVVEHRKNIPGPSSSFLGGICFIKFLFVFRYLQSGWKNGRFEFSGPSPFINTLRGNPKNLFIFTKLDFLFQMQDFLSNYHRWCSKSLLHHWQSVIKIFGGGALREIVPKNLLQKLSLD